MERVLEEIKRNNVSFTFCLTFIGCWTKLFAFPSRRVFQVNAMDLAKFV